jgi:hypothetical protein
LIELADSFLEITKGFDMPVGSVVVLSSLSYLAKVGTATYAEELVRSLALGSEMPMRAWSGLCMDSRSSSGD